MVNIHRHCCFAVAWPTSWLLFFFCLLLFWFRAAECVVCPHNNSATTNSHWYGRISLWNSQLSLSINSSRAKNESESVQRLFVQRSRANSWCHILLVFKGSTGWCWLQLTFSSTFFHSGNGFPGIYPCQWKEESTIHSSSVRLLLSRKSTAYLHTTLAQQRLNAT